jgi:hypothetical protein
MTGPPKEAVPFSLPGCIEGETIELAERVDLKPMLSQINVFDCDVIRLSGR